MALNLVVDYFESKEAIDEKAIADYLLTTGFEDHEIRQVVMLLDMHGQFTVPIRTFTRNEQQVFDREGLDYLQKLLIAGVLDVLSLEEIIERSLEQDPYRVELEQIKQILLYILLERKADITPGFNPGETTH